MRELDIAIIGMACRLPGAGNLNEYWEQLQSGVESIAFLSDDELRAANVEPDVFERSDYVRAAPLIDGAYDFDAAFFRFSPREARAMDPQHRLFLECAWEGLEQAGYRPDACPGPVGVFGGSAMGTYLLHSGGAARFADDYLMTLIGNDKDYLTTRVSYLLNLTGPSVAVQTACSTALVAIHLACQSLLNAECDLALAGAVSVRVPQTAGYRYRPGGPMSPDGRCRAFDAAAGGTIFGSGVGCVVLKRLADARADGDHIDAVIRGSAVNNDGSAKVDFMAPSVDRQADAVSEALANAEVAARSIGYIEAHGTGTRLGDMVEIAALTKAFRTETPDCGFCTIGSVKTNIGHLDAAAGIAGLIKAVLALQHSRIPPSLHFDTPNPELRLPETPFRVCTELTDWPANGMPRRAAVNALGIGGTNAFVVLEEAPAAAPASSGRSVQVLALSARTPASLNRAAIELAGHLDQNPRANLADVAFTLQCGRKPFSHRRAIVCRDIPAAIAQLTAEWPSHVCDTGQEPEVVFLFAGQGTQRVGMGSELYRSESVFRTHIDACADILAPVLKRDLRAFFLPLPGKHDATAEALAQTCFAQPALFAFEYALAQLWISWGVRPAALIGHSLGEYAAACLAGVFSLSDALRLVAVRGRLMQTTAPGAMLTTSLTEAEVQRHLTGTLALAAANAPERSVVSGAPEEITSLRETLHRQGSRAHLLAAGKAFHSPLMEPVLGAFTEAAEAVELRPPVLPLISNVSGGWLSATDACDPGYWARHMRKTVRFSEGIALLSQRPGRVFLEIGPDTTLTQLAGATREACSGCTLLASFADPRRSEVEAIHVALADLWLNGVNIDWLGFHADDARQRVPLPTYPFERRTYSAAAVPPSSSGTPAAAANADTRSSDEGMQHGPGGSAIEATTPPCDISRETPHEHIEAILVDIWCEALGIDTVGPNDNFFELGGQSLLMTEVTGRVNRRFDIDLSLLSLYSAPTIADLTESIKAVIAARFSWQEGAEHAPRPSGP
jgi:acyl transferase domain-containing protein